MKISDDGKWNSNTKEIVKKGNAKLWFLRRLKLLRASKSTLIEIYKLFCRPCLEYCAPVWAGALTKKNSQDIERIQKNAFRIILGKDYQTYEDALSDIEEPSLLERRRDLCLKFAKNCLKQEKFKNWFQSGKCTRNSSYLLEPVSKTKRYRNSPIPYMTRLLNQNVS